MPKNKIQIELQESKYIITDGEYTISFKIGKEGISIYRQIFFNQNFDFSNTKRETVEGIAKLLLEVVKFVKNFEKL